MDRPVKEDRVQEQGVLEVSKTHLVAALSACLLVASLAVGPASAQTAPRPSIAVLDINYIFKTHAGFKARMADMKAEVEQAEARMKAERDSIQQLSEQLKEYTVGTPQYKQLESQIVGRMADLNAQAQLQRKEFLLKESQIYHIVYQEIQQVVGYYAASQGLSAVIKFNGDAVKENNPDDVLRSINQDMVWYRPELDITPIILQQLNGRGASANRTNTPTGGTPVPTRQGVPFNR
jgi:Skp family chaperone for outer membrane proteins